MAFRPIDPPSRTLAALAPVAYTIRVPSKGSTGGKNPSFFVRFTPDIAKKAGIKAGEALQLCLGEGSDAGSLQFMPTMKSTAARRVRAGKGASACLTWACPFTGDLAQVLPIHRKPTTLTVVEASQSSGLVVQLPL